MERLKRCLSGRHTPGEIRWHLAALAVVYWGLVFCAWLGYNTGRPYSITGEMLSALGSFDDHQNPQWFWIFTVAMVYCGLIMTPVMFYVYRRFAAVSPWGARVGAFFFLLGCAGIVFTGLFPYGHGRAFGVWPWRKLHMSAGATIAVGFSLGFFWHAMLLLKDRITGATLRERGDVSYARMASPFLVCVPLLGTIAYRLNWPAAFSALHAAVTGSSEAASEQLHASFVRLHHFPLLEHMSIWALTIFVIWFTAVLPHRLEPEEE